MVDAPPVMPDGKSGSGVQSLLPMAGIGVSMTVMLFARGSGYAALGAVVMVAAVVAAVAFYLSQRGQAGRKRRQHRERYLDYLEELREELREWEQDFRVAAERPDPAPSQLLDVVANPARLWERRRTDPDFLRVRVGSGGVAARTVQVKSEASASNPGDPFMVAEARALAERFGQVRGVPVRVNLDQVGDVAVIGARQEVLGVAQAVLAQVLALHCPDDVTVAIICPQIRVIDWAWARWLPHISAPSPIGEHGPQPLIAASAAALVELLAEDLTDRATRAAQSFRHGGGATEALARSRLLIIDDCYGDVAAQLPITDQSLVLAQLGVTMLHLLADQLSEPSEIAARITVTGQEVTVQEFTDETRRSTQGDRDLVCGDQVEALARVIAPLRLSADSYDDGTGTASVDAAQLLGLEDPAALPLAELWSPRTERNFLRVPIGVDTAGRPVLLDLKESSQLGMGPHGLCVGATGSGKSELLRTIVLALGATHPPEQLSMVLVDYKGGATFAPFTSLPHVAGLITNLVADASLVERMYSSLEGEIKRRQQVLADAGKIVDITEYHRVQAELTDPTVMPVLPHLVVMIDEFGELLTAKPDFIELFLQIGRIGRSIGVHLLLSSQRIESGKLRGLDTYLSYRLGLRTLSTEESRTVLDTPDAFRLPALPGFAYLKVDVTIYEQFKSAYVSAPLHKDTEQVASAAAPTLTLMPYYGARDPSLIEPAGPEMVATRRGSGPTLVSTVIDQLSAAGNPVAPIWLPPLPETLTLAQAAGGWEMTARGIRLSTATTDPETLQVALGVLDDPTQQWQGPWLLNLDAAGGNLMLLGGPGSGKTTALRTLALSLASSYSPTDVGIYGIDLLGSGLRWLEGLPHVGGVCSRDDRDRVRRTIEEVHTMLTERETLFRLHALDTTADLRRARAAGDLSDLACTDVVLLIDGYGQIGTEFDSLEPQIHALLERGGRFGIHVVVTARRWNEVRGAQQVALGNRIELRLVDPAESSIHAPTARTIMTGQHGRALNTDLLLGQFALPRLDSTADLAAAGLQQAAELIRNTWSGPVPPPVRVLPPVLGYDEVQGHTDVPGALVMGRFEDDFTPSSLDLSQGDQHLLVLGDSGAGKTNVLTVLITELVDCYTPDELVFAVFDPRRGLANIVPEDYLGGYADNATLAAQLATSVCGELAARSQPAAGDTQRPRVVLVIDDYDVLAAGGSDPLAAFHPFLAAGRDLGLSVLMTRRVMGAARGLFERFTLGVRESGAVTLLMSGDPGEGLLLPGVRPRTMPPGRAQLIRLGSVPRTLQTALRQTPTEDPGL